MAGVGPFEAIADGAAGEARDDGPRSVRGERVDDGAVDRGGLSRPPSSSRARRACPRRASIARSCETSSAPESIKGGLSRPPSTGGARRASPRRASIARSCETSSALAWGEPAPPPVGSGKPKRSMVRAVHKDASGVRSVSATVASSTTRAPWDASSAASSCGQAVAAVGERAQRRGRRHVVGDGAWRLAAERALDLDARLVRDAPQLAVVARLVAGRTAAGVVEQRQRRGATDLAERLGERATQRRRRGRPALHQRALDVGALLPARRACPAPAPRCARSCRPGRRRAPSRKAARLRSWRACATRPMSRVKPRALDAEPPRRSAPSPREPHRRRAAPAPATPPRPTACRRWP